MSKRAAITTSSIVVLVASLLFVGGIAYLVLVAPGQVGYRTIFETLRTFAQVGAAAALIAIVVFSLGVLRKATAAQALAGLGALLFAVPVVTLFFNEASAPPGDLINDITTDLEDPPKFSAVIPLREPGSNPIEYGGAEVAAVQRQVHPEVQPIFSDLSVDDAFEHAFLTAEDLGWDIVSGDLQAGVIEAVDTTTFFRFKDDVVIRIRPTGTGSRIDLRSRSRVGRSDLGKNAARIMEFSEAFRRDS